MHKLHCDMNGTELDEVAAYLAVNTIDAMCCDVRDIHGKRIGRVQSIVLETAEAVVMLTTPEPSAGAVTIMTANGPAEATVDITGCTLNFFRPGEPSDAKPHTVITLPVASPRLPSPTAELPRI